MLLYFCNISIGITIKGSVHPKVKVWSSARLHVCATKKRFLLSRLSARKCQKNKKERKLNL